MQNFGFRGLRRRFSGGSSSFLGGDSRWRFGGCSGAVWRLFGGGLAADRRRPDGFMASFGTLLLDDTKGCFRLHSIRDEEAKFKLCKVRLVQFGQKGIPYLNTYDGRTIHYPDPLIKANDTIKLDLEGASRSDQEQGEAQRRPGGERIYNVFDNQLPAALKRLQFDKQLSMENVRKLITEVDEYQPHLIAPEQGYRHLIESSLVSIRGPSEASVDAVHAILKELVHKAIRETVGGS